MAKWLALDDAAVRHLAGALFGAGRLLYAVPAADAAKQLGWAERELYPQSMMMLDPGLGSEAFNAAFALDDADRVTEILVDISESTMDADAELDAFRQDVFAAAAAALTQAYGPPSDRLPGAPPQLWWRRDGLVLQLSIDDYSVRVRLLRAEDADRPEQP